MRVNAVGDNRIDIYLSESEMLDTFGGYEYIDYNLPECRNKIHALISSVIPETHLPLDCKKVLIEVKPYNTGCFISFIKVYSGAKRLRTVKHITMIFENSDDLISSLWTLKELNALSAGLYSNGRRYALIASLKYEDRKNMLHISEYCKISFKENDAVRIQEYWHPICKRGAINYLASAFLN